MFKQFAITAFTIMFLSCAVSMAQDVGKDKKAAAQSIEQILKQKKAEVAVLEKLVAQKKDGNAKPQSCGSQCCCRAGSYGYCTSASECKEVGGFCTGEPTSGC